MIHNMYISICLYDQTSKKFSQIVLLGTFKIILFYEVSPHGYFFGSINHYCLSRRWSKKKITMIKNL